MQARTQAHISLPPAPLPSAAVRVSSVRTRRRHQCHAVEPTRRDLLGAVSAGSLLCACPACAQAVQGQGTPPSANGSANLRQSFFAYSMATGMDNYEAAVAPWKQELFAKLMVQDPPRILDLGIGTGPNLKYIAQTHQQRQQTTQESTPLQVVGLDPNPAMLPYAKQAALEAGLPGVSLVTGVAEDLPFPSSSFDAVVITLVLCSVTDPTKAMSEVRRVLRPQAQALFIEHVAAPWQSQPLVRAQQALLDPLQISLADGCHLQRNTKDNLQTAGFSELSLLSENLQGISSTISPHITI